MVNIITLYSIRVWRTLYSKYKTAIIIIEVFHTICQGFSFCTVILNCSDVIKKVYPTISFCYVKLSAFW